MKKTLVAFLFLLAGTYFANAQSPVLDGTVWRYQDKANKRDYNNTLAPGGKLITKHPNDTSPDNDTWWIDTQGRVVMSFNDGYAIYTGVLKKNGTLIQGTAKNEAGKEWKYKMTKVKK